MFRMSSPVKTQVLFTHSQPESEVGLGVGHDVGLGIRVGVGVGVGVEGGIEGGVGGREAVLSRWKYFAESFISLKNAVPP